MSADFKIRNTYNVSYSGYNYTYDVYSDNRYGERYTLNTSMTSMYDGPHYTWCCLHSSSPFCSAIT